MTVESGGQFSPSNIKEIINVQIGKHEIDSLDVLFAIFLASLIGIIVGLTVI